MSFPKEMVIGTSIVRVGSHTGFSTTNPQVRRSHGLGSDTTELRLKLNQSRAMLADLRKFYNEGKLTIESAAVRSEFRFRSSVYSGSLFALER